MSDIPDTLYHFTCKDHGFAGIGEEGELVPGADRSDTLATYWPAHFVWLTDLSRPLREPLGLTQQIKGSCDRTTHRYRVLDTSNVVWWAKARRKIKDTWILEQGEARPIHWFVSPVPVPVIYDPLVR